jgi:hypothetical protein
VSLPLPLPLQASGQPPGLSEIEAERIKALQVGDSEAASRAELGILTSLLAAQFGPARVDPDQVGGQDRGPRVGVWGLCGVWLPHCWPRSLGWRAWTPTRWAGRALCLGFVGLGLFGVNSGVWLPHCWRRSLGRPTWTQTRWAGRGTVPRIGGLGLFWGNFGVWLPRCWRLSLGRPAWIHTRCPCCSCMPGLGLSLGFACLPGALSGSWVGLSPK